MSDSRAIRIAVFHRPLAAMWSTSGSFPQKNFAVFLQESKCHLYFFLLKYFHCGHVRLHVIEKWI